MHRLILITILALAGCGGGTPGPCDGPGWQDIPECVPPVPLPCTYPCSKPSDPPGG